MFQNHMRSHVNTCDTRVMTRVHMRFWNMFVWNFCKGYSSHPANMLPFHLSFHVLLSTTLEPRRPVWRILYVKIGQSCSQSRVWKIGLGWATRCLWWAGFEVNWRPSWKDHPTLGVCDEQVLKPIDGHLGNTTRSSVFVSKSYCEASEIGLECSQYVPFDNFKRKYY